MQRVRTAAWSALVLVPALAMFGAGLLVWGLRCDEGCYDTSNRPYEPGHAWIRYVHSWQWSAQLDLSVAGFVAALAAARMISRHRRHPAWVAVVSAVLSSAAWFAWIVRERG